VFRVVISIKKKKKKRKSEMERRTARKESLLFNTGDEIVWEGQASKISIFACTLAGFSIFTCYFIAVSLGHAPAWLPMISDCAIQAPEKYIFRIGLISSALLLELNSVLMLFFLNTPEFGRNKSVDYIALYVVSLACFGLSMVGAINEQENNPVHSAAAVAFFIGYEFYMCVITYRLNSVRKTSTKITPLSINIKLILSSICGVALLLFFYFSTSWGTYHLYIAICEWVGVYSIILFNLSYISEYKTNLDLAALEQPSSVTHFALRNPEYYIDN